MSKSVVALIVLFFLVASCLTGAKPSLAASAAENAWIPKTQMPEAGVSGAAVVNNKIYAFSYNNTFEYKPSTDTWTQKEPIPTHRSGFATAVYQNKIYCIGGWESCSNDAYDPSTDTWETKEPMPAIRSTIGANVVYGKIHVIGADSHDVYDIATDSWASEEPPPLYFHFGSTVLDGRVYVFGTNRTQIYDPVTGSWDFGASPPNPVSSPAVCATTGVLASKRIYVIGGSPEWMHVLWSGNTQVYDPVTDSWTLGEGMLTARFGLEAVVVNDLIYAIGGSQGLYSLLATNEQYTPFGYGTPDPSYDGTAPEFVVASPANITYYTADAELNFTDVALNFTVDEPVFSVHYRLDGGVPVEVSGNTTLEGLAIGAHNVTVFGFDASGNIGTSETLYFTIEKPEPFPFVPVVAASSIVIILAGAGLMLYFKKRKRQADSS